MTMQSFFDIQAQYHAHHAEINDAVQTVLASGQFIQGPQVKALEQALCDYTGARHCITCANGTDALQIALMALGVGPGDEVITTPFTFVATAETIVLLGAKPVFVDIEEESYLIDANLIAEKITPKTKAIIPVSLYGQIADMDAINQIAAEYSEKLGHKITVIEDAAQSFGATYKGKRSCNVSELSTTSFFPTKPLGCYGDGGAIFTSNDALAATIRSLCNHGQSERYVHTLIGVNSRLDTLQAAILQIKLKHFDAENNIRVQNALNYNQQFNNTDVITPTVLPERTHVYGQYTVRVKNREKFQADLKAKGIPTAVHYPVPLHRQPAFLDTSASCPIAEKLSAEVVSLPMCLYEKMAPCI